MNEDFKFNGNVATIGTYRRLNEKYHRNSKCSCGSGKKHKNCCGKTVKSISEIYFKA